MYQLCIKQAPAVAKITMQVVYLLGLPCPSRDKDYPVGSPAGDMLEL